MEYRIKKRMQTIGKINLLQLLEDSNGICGICNLAIADKYHIDHIHPISKGGLHTQNNLQITHPKCNLQKGNSF